MSLSRQDVAKVALLSRLALSDSEVDSLTGELSKIVDFVSQLGAVDTSAVEPLAHPLDSHNVFRDDVVAASLPRDAVLRSAPRHDDECFLVPAVLGESGAA